MLQMNSTSDTTLTNGSLFSFWELETVQTLSERNHCDFEELKNTRETQALTEEWSLVMQKAQWIVCEQESQQKHKDTVHDRKIAAGWKPNQKCVSFPLLRQLPLISYLGYRNTSRSSIQHHKKAKTLLSIHNLIVNTKRIGRQIISHKAENVKTYSGVQSLSTGIFLFFGRK